MATRWLARMVLILAAVETSAPAADRCGDPAAVATARSAIAEQCTCDAPSHGAYLSCVAGVVRDLVATQQVTRACGSAARKCAARSTCGRPGAVTCCRNSSSGTPRCRIASDAVRCRASGGCVGSFTSCCDACGPSGCVTSTTSTTSTTGTTVTSTMATTSTTSTTLPPAVCGDGVIGRYEECDGEIFCEPTNCQIYRYACCQYGSGDTACSAAVPGFTLHVYQYQACGQYGGTFLMGAAQVSTDPCANPPPNAPATYAGSCGSPPPLPAPVTVCCRHNASDGVGTGCHESTVANQTALAIFDADCAYNNTPDIPGTTVVGTCGPDGHCVPAH